ncbi:nicotinamide-nucleotide amidohydrolase family protein [uncultured Selenomonas sp.]|uniref:CinA family protein n=1 Tax=uncultured Selenomonas sp. TaxID=159275 RepID=UPI0028E48573|nr:nicotinamide-nucleotide amidohydrolase family protein [uncultured Selenomonas sp.]
MAEEKESLEALVGRLLRECGRTIACAESCTGGLLTSRLTDVAGSSAYVMGAVVSYTNEVKASLVGVHEATLKEFGAVSEETAREMAEGVRHAIPADIGVGITGIAGPGGATAEKPVGLVYIAVAAEHMTHAVRHVFSGSRAEVKRQSTEAALAMVRDLILDDSH